MHFLTLFFMKCSLFKGLKDLIYKCKNEIKISGMLLDIRNKAINLFTVVI